MASGLVTLSTGGEASVSLPINKGQTTTTQKPTHPVTSAKATFFGTFKAPRVINGHPMMSGSAEVKCPEPIANKDNSYVIDTSANDSNDRTCDWAGGKEK